MGNLEGCKSEKKIDQCKPHKVDLCHLFHIYTYIYKYCLLKWAFKKRQHQSSPNDEYIFLRIILHQGSGLANRKQCMIGKQAGPSSQQVSPLTALLLLMKFS